MWPPETEEQKAPLAPARTKVDHKAILNALSEGKIKWDLYFMDPYLEKIREALGIQPPWYVGPGAQFWPFLKSPPAVELSTVAERLGIEALDGDDYLWHVAAHLALRI